MQVARASYAENVQAADPPRRICCFLVTFIFHRIYRALDLALVVELWRCSTTAHLHAPGALRDAACFHFLVVSNSYHNAS